MSVKVGSTKINGIFMVVRRLTSPARLTASRFDFIVGLNRRFLPCILIRIKIPEGAHCARTEDARVIGQRRRAGG